MISGQQILAYLNQGLGTIRNDVDRVDSELNKYSEALHENSRSQTTALKQIAKMRLEGLAQEQFLGALEAADQRALGLLAERHMAHQDLEIEITEQTQDLEKLEAERQSALEGANEKAQVVIEMEHQIQSALEEDEHYQQQLQSCRKLDSIAMEAEQKASQAELDRQQKGSAYEDNIFFKYLWQRHYGTQEYQANRLTRYLDSWVEKHCDYNRYRGDYWALLEIPKRLKAHVKQARQQAEASLQVLSGLEAEQATKLGLPQRQAQHAKALQQLDDIDLHIEQLENSAYQSLKQRRDFLEAKDSYMQEALKVLKAALQTKTIQELSLLVVQTDQEQDDALLRELAELREKHQDLEEELGDHRGLHELKLGRLQQLELLRRQYKQRRFDDLRSGFSNESLISAMFEQFMNGLVDGDELWRVLQRHQRHQDIGAWPDFGSGGLGLPSRRRSPWHLPSGRGGSTGSFRLPRSGGFRSRGGFRTGGGF